MQQASPFFNAPLLESARIDTTKAQDASLYPFSLGIITNVKEIYFPTQVTFFVGENGTGKSTLLEALAHCAGFGAEGGSKHIAFKTAKADVYKGIEQLAHCMTLSWRQKPQDGYFFKAESFYNLANYLDALERDAGGGAYNLYGGKSLHNQSHGESFFSFFKNRIHRGGFFIFDEPEAALSPLRQLSLLLLIRDFCKDPSTQFIIATHSPILLAYPGALIYSCDDEHLPVIKYIECASYQLTKQFLNNPDLYVKKLFCEQDF